MAPHASKWLHCAVALAVLAGLAGCKRPAPAAYRLGGPVISTLEMGQCVADAVGVELKEKNIDAIEVVRGSRWESHGAVEMLDSMRRGHWQEFTLYEVSFGPGGTDQSTITLDHAPPGTFGWMIRANAAGIVGTMPTGAASELGQVNACDALLEYVAKPVLMKIDELRQSES